MAKNSINNFKKLSHRNRRTLKVVTTTTIVILIYLIGQVFFHQEWMTESIATIIAIITVLTFWLEYHDNKLLNEAQFIIELNNQLLSDENLSSVEWELIKYYAKFRNNTLTDEDNNEFIEQFDIEKKDRQLLINYLVHLEGIATMVSSGVLHLDIIDDLMSYRYFIAVNNPIIQKLELLPYSDYYKGCISIYEEWVKELEKQNAVIPMYDKDTNNLIKKLEEARVRGSKN